MQLQFIQRSEVNEVILGTLQAALLPLANVVTEKLDDSDRRLRIADAVGRPPHSLAMSDVDDAPASLATVSLAD